MDIWKYYAITHGDHLFCNPIGEAKIREFISLVEWPQSPRILDIACGKAELLCRLVEATDGEGVGIDISPFYAREAWEKVLARGLGDRIEIVHGDAAKYEADADSFDFISCLGATWIWKNLQGVLAVARYWTRPGGTIAVGDIFWKQPPPAEYLAAVDLNIEDCGTHFENVKTGEELGLIPLYTLVSTPDEFDRYEWLQVRAAMRWLRENPDDPDGEFLRKKIIADRDAYLKWGREVLGWCIYVFRKP